MPTTVITGANRGIGLELTRLARERGDAVAICRESSRELDAIGARIERGVDGRRDAHVDALASRLSGTPIDVLILNAGRLVPDELESVSLEDVREQLEVNALGPLRVARALRGNLEKGSKIALITSRMGSLADNTSGGYYGYRASKAALNAIGVSLAIDLKPAGIAVAMLHPGFVRTGMTGGAGHIDPAQSARGLWARIDALALESSGGFWHLNGERLPW